MLSDIFWYVCVVSILHIVTPHETSIVLIVSFKSIKWQELIAVICNDCSVACRYFVIIIIVIISQIRWRCNMQ